MVRIQQLREKLQSKTSSADCPACGEQLQVNNTGTVAILAAEPEPDQHRTTDPAMEALLLQCPNCGYMRFHRISALEGWTLGTG